MSETEAIDAHRKALERTIAVRKARLKTRKQLLKSELHARLTPKGIVSRFPITTLLIATGIGWLMGRAVRALITPQPSYTKAALASPRRPQTPSPVIQTLKDIAFQTLTNFLLNKTRNFLVNRLNVSHTPKNDFSNIPKPSRAEP